jgi:hypothetical protein
METEKNQGGGYMKNAKHHDLAAQQTRESIAIRMESFGDEFVRLAHTAGQGALAARFSDAVGEIVSLPLTAADLQPLGEWLKGYGAEFEQAARTAGQKQLAASFMEFSAEVSGPEVREVFQRPLVNALIEEITSALADGHSNGVPVAWLSDADRKEYLGVVIDWTDYIDRGLDLERDTAGHIERIVDNAIAGKPCEQWMGRCDPLDLAAPCMEMRADEAAVRREDAHCDGMEALKRFRDEIGSAPAAEKARDNGIER